MTIRFPHPRREPQEYPRSETALRLALIEGGVTAAARQGAALSGGAAEALHEAARVAARALAARIERDGRFSAGDAVSVDRALQAAARAVEEALGEDPTAALRAPFEAALWRRLLARLTRDVARATVAV